MQAKMTTTNPKRTMVTATVLVGVLCGCSIVAAQESEEPQLNDRTISNAVEEELLFDRAVDLNDIDVWTSEGIVTLKGTVDSILEEERAVRLAETVKGVRSVVERIEVVPARMKSAATLESDVSAALLADPATDAYELTVEAVEEGVVTLNGTVQSWHEKQLAGLVAKSVDGVTGLHNNVTVKYERDRPDIEIKPEIEQKLKWDVLVNGVLIDIAVDDGHVELSGTVGSAAEKRRAITNAWVPGVEDVDASKLKVQDWARDKRNRKHTAVTRDDDAIRDAIEDAFLYDPRVFSFDIDPIVSYGYVTLRGTVDNLKASRAAAMDARNTFGVRRVTNRIKIRPEGQIANEVLADRVRSALLRDPFVNRFDCVVNALNGKVYLTGKVDSYFEKGQAEDIASRVNGVERVINNLSVDNRKAIAYDPYIDDWYVYGRGWYTAEPVYTTDSDEIIRQNIKNELWWSPFVDANNVNVTVHDGMAVLTGTVDSRSEWYSANANALEAGAAWVNNKLRVE